MKTCPALNLLPWRDDQRRRRRYRHYWIVWSMTAGMSIAVGGLWYQHWQIMHDLHTEWAHHHAIFMSNQKAHARAEALNTWRIAQRDQWQQFNEERVAHRHALTFIHTVLSVLPKVFAAHQLQWEGAALTVRGRGDSAGLVQSLQAHGIDCHVLHASGEVTLTCQPPAPREIAR